MQYEDDYSYELDKYMKHLENVERTYQERLNRKLVEDFERTMKDKEFGDIYGNSNW